MQPSLAEKLVAASYYLTNLKDKSAIAVDTPKEELFDTLETICAQLGDFDPSSLETAEEFLIQTKTDFAFAWSLSELQAVGTQDNRGRWQTRFAQESIEYALKLAWVSVAGKHKVLQGVLDENKGTVPGLFIFGMGKLGGYDLNFSSDVDLIAYYDPQILPVPEMLGKSYICHQVLQKLTQILGQGGRSNFIWRVDWRLRPNASATTLAMSTEAAEDYYFYRASPWHRLALMKARVVAGDKALGESFLELLTPFIWRQNLDYRALDELAEIKQRINLEHPALRAQRQWREPIVDEIGGFNVKLGSGGIREIEFIANALQLIWGGRVYELRTPQTLAALAVLSEYGHLDRSVAKRLGESYQTLRRIENAIQILGNQQTHLIPGSEEQQGALLVLLQLDQWSELVDLLNDVRQFVNDYFEELFAEQTSAQGPAAVWPEGLSSIADEIIQGWEDGYQAYGVSNQVRHRLLPLTHALSKYLCETSESASETILRLHEFFKALPSGEQYFRLLAESPTLLGKFAAPLLHSPPMTILLKQSPHIIDCYVRERWSYPEPFDSRYVTQSDQYEHRLERLRRFVNEHLYQLYLSFLEGQMSVDTFQSSLSDLAEHTLELALQFVAEHLGFDEVPITVIGMGKVALRRMSPLSDLDLIFVYDPEQISLEQASKYVSRLQTAISTPMREGIVYELDTRLRPSGRSGAPTVSIESFANHHRTRAHTWEHIALAPSRVVAGNKKPIDRLNEIKREVIFTPRDQDQLLRDGLKMWDRIATHRVSDAAMDLMNSKMRVGGLMQAEYLAACLILKSGAELSLDSIEFDDLLAESLRSGEYSELPEIIQFWRVQQLWERLLGKTGSPVDSIPEPYLGYLLAQSGVDTVEQLIAKKNRYAKLVDDAMNELFSSVEMDHAEIEAWLERSVIWV